MSGINGHDRILLVLQLRMGSRVFTTEELFCGAIYLSFIYFLISKAHLGKTLMTSYKPWNRLMAGFFLGQLSFLLQAASDTLPTEVNLRRAFSLMCSVLIINLALQGLYNCTYLGWLLCELSSTICYAYRHDRILHLFASRLAGIFVSYLYIHVYIC